MDGFNWTQFTKRIAIKASLKQLYNAWTLPEEIENWFLSKALFEREQNGLIPINSNICKGDKYQWSWYLFDLTERGEILEANGSDLIKFTFAGDCSVEVKLIPEGEHVVVELNQRNIPTDDNSKKGIRLGCDSGWSFFLLNLKSVYEGGLDLRNKNPNFVGMLNN